MKDADLLKILHENTSYGIEVAIDTYGKAVKTICQTILTGFSEEDVEEAVSDTFVGLWKAIDRIKLERETGLKEYLYGIARRTALNKRRKLANKLVFKTKTVENKLVRGKVKLRKQLINIRIELV